MLIITHIRRALMPRNSVILWYCFIYLDTEHCQKMKKIVWLTVSIWYKLYLCGFIVTRVKMTPRYKACTPRLFISSRIFIPFDFTGKWFWYLLKTIYTVAPRISVNDPVLFCENKWYVYFRNYMVNELQLF